VEVAAAMIVLRVFGRFSITDENGRSFTPKGLKARGVLALLALAPDHCRTREWLQDKLWSERNRKQGSESLRQVLTEIRKALGTESDVLQTDREKVALDPRRFALLWVSQAEPYGDEPDTELFSDLNINDQEFQEWIRNRRLALARPSPLGVPVARQSARIDNPAIFFRYDGTGSQNGETTVKGILALATASLLDFSDFQIFQELGKAPLLCRGPISRGLVVSLTVAAGNRSQHLHVTFLHPETNRVFWSRSFTIWIDADFFYEEQFHPICAEIVFAVLTTFKTRRDELGIVDCGALLAIRGRGLIFQFDRRSLSEADGYLRLAYDYEPRPQYLAWRAFLRNMANFQHRSCGFLGDAVEIETLAREAIQQAPNSAIALGVGAHIEYLAGGSHRTSLQLANRAVSVNHAILSISELIVGNLADSRRSSLNALALSQSSDCRAFIEFFCCMSAAALGDYHVAIDHAEQALLLRPSFRAPLRYLVALYRHAGRTVDLSRAVARMRSVEPDFHIGRFLDDDYPVTTLRRIPLIEAIARHW
jgi:hypothetical protein